MSLRFAMVTDTHVGMTGASVERLRPVYAAIARRAPDFVLHCGDITDTGLPGEYERYWQTVPAALRGRIRHVPAIARCAGTRRPKDSTGSSSAPRRTRSTREACTSPGSTWRSRCWSPPTPVRPRWSGSTVISPPQASRPLLFQHFPVGGEHDYVDDQAALLELIARHDVRVLVAGHVHREAVTRLDGSFMSVFRMAVS